MKKLFTLMLALVAIVAVNAKQVTFDFTNPTALGITPSAEKSKGVEIPAEGISVDGVIMTSTKVQKNANVLFTKSDATTYELRTYNTNTITFTAEDNITAVEFVGSDIKYAEVTGKSWVATSDVKTVTFTGSGTSKVTSIVVTVGEAAVIWKPDTVNVAEARALIDAKDANDHFVKGIVATQPFNTFSSFDGRVSFYLVDDLLSTDSLQAYQVNAQNYAKWESLEAAIAELRIGDTVLVYAGSLKLYEAKNIYEIDPGYYVEKLGANLNPPEVIVPQLDTITVAQAVELAQALDEGKSTSKEYVVAGYAVSVYDKNSDGSWSFYMHDNAGAKGEFMASNCTADADVNENDFMLVRGTLTKYKSKSGNIILQIYKGTAVHGQSDAQTIEVNVAGAMEAGNALEANATTKDIYVVTGYVAKANQYDEENHKQTFYMSDDKEATYGEFAVFDAKLDAPVEAGFKVKVTGVILKYVNKEGTKTTIEIKGGKVEVLEGLGIENVVLTEKAQKVVVDGVLYIIRDNKMYDVRGTQVR